MVNSPLIVTGGERGRTIIEIATERAEELQGHLRKHGVTTAVVNDRKGTTILEVITAKGDSVETVVSQFPMARLN